jgi:hypothetical protein
MVRRPERQRRPGVVVHPADRRVAFDRPIVAGVRSTADRSPRARTVIVNEVCSRSRFRAIRKRAFSTSPVPTSQSWPSQSSLAVQALPSPRSDRLLSFLIPGKQSLQTLTESSRRCSAVIRKESRLAWRSPMASELCKFSSKALGVTLILDLPRVLEKLWKAANLFHASRGFARASRNAGTSGPNARRCAVSPIIYTAIALASVMTSTSPAAGPSPVAQSRRLQESHQRSDGAFGNALD